MLKTLSAFLRHIPQSNQQAVPLAQLGDPVTLDGVARCLALLGMVEYDPQASSIRASSQAAKYALLSLAEYADAEQTVVSEWRLRGLYPDGTDDPLQNGASFVHLLEKHRLRLMPDGPPTRQQKVAQVLIKRSHPDTGQAEFLFQRDENARRDQLIGGRMNEQDQGDPLRTLLREIDEEMPHMGLAHPTDYRLHLVVDAYKPPPSLSVTFGAYTAYTFWLYHMRGLQRPLPLGPQDRWISLEQVLSPDFEAPLPGQDEHLFRLIDRQIVGGLASLPNSTENP